MQANYKAKLDANGRYVAVMETKQGCFKTVSLSYKTLTNLNAYWGKKNGIFFRPDTLEGV